MEHSIFLSHESDKSDEYKKNQNLDDLLLELKKLLHPIQKEVESNIQEHKYPLLFVVGAPRSGTTIFTQWVASLGSHAYGSNFLTRFAYAPYVGALIQKLLFDDKYDFHGDFYDVSSKINLKSNLGKSKGALALNEFQHFFRNYMNNFDPEYIEESEFNTVKLDELFSGFATIEAVFNKPFCTKAFMLQYNIEQVWEVNKNIIFAHIERDPLYNMQSILLARRKYYNNDKIWLGAKPKEYKNLKNEDVYTQIAGQVYFTNRYLKKALARINKNNTIHVLYEDFVGNTKKYFDQLYNKYIELGYKLNSYSNNFGNLSNTNEVKLSKRELENLKRAYKLFLSQDSI